MKNPFSVLHEVIYPQLKVDITHQLLHQGYSQQAIATALDTTQPQICHYAKKKVVLQPALQQFSNELVQLIIKHADQNTIARTICERSLAYAKAGHLCHSCGIEGCTVCVNLPSYHTEYAHVLEHLQSAAELLSEHNPVHLMPQVRMNIAECIPHPTSASDIASFPGRITVVNGKITCVSSPAFNASHHLSEILLDAHTIDSSINAVMNILYQQKLKLHTCKAQRKKPFSCAMKKGMEALNDPGDIGIEPCTYVFGRDARDVVQKIVLCVTTDKS